MSTCQPRIALCHAESALRYRAVATHATVRESTPPSAGLMWMLAREVLCTSGTMSHAHPREVVPELYCYRGPAETGKGSD